MRAKILNASAGSGKTYRLAYKFVHDTVQHYYTKPYLYRAILAVTFTNKATEEMKSRILGKLHELSINSPKSDYMADLQRDLCLTREQIAERARGLQARILHDYSHFTILTIDKFFQRILRAFIKELSIDLNYNLELSTDTILARSTDSLIEEIPYNEELREWILEYVQERIEQGKQWDLRGTIRSLGKNLFDESIRSAIEQAPSKSTMRELVGEASKRNAQATAEIETLARKAIAIMDGAGVLCSDFSGASRSFAFIFPRLLSDAQSNITATMRKLSLTTDGWSKDHAAQALAPQLQPLLHEIIKIRDKNDKVAATLSLIKGTYHSYALMKDLNEKVEQQCQSEGVMLLSQTKHILSRFIEHNDAPFIYEKTGNRFERFMIDEFQDTSRKEWANFVPLLRNAISQAEEESVLIVGDVKQSIYRWRGGDWRILHSGVSEDLGRGETTTEFMQNNYRSLSQIVEFNNMAIGQITALDNSTLNKGLDKALSEEKISPTCHAELYSTLLNAYSSFKQTACKEGSHSGYVRVEMYDSEQEPPMVEYIENAIKRGYKYKDILILCRSKSDSARAAQILLRYKRLNNEFNIMTQESLIVGNSSVCNFVIAVMRLSQDAGDAISLAIYNDYLSREYNTPLDDEEQRWLRSISQLSPDEAFDHIVKRYALGEQAGEVAYLQALHEQVVAFCSSSIADIALFLDEWDEKGKDEALSVEMSDNTIELLTIHKAKGLEKKVVIIPYCKWRLDASGSGMPNQESFFWATPDNASEPLAGLGRVPITFKSDMTSAIYADDYHREQVASHVEAINMLYVALTRAQEELYIGIPHQPKSRQHVGSVLWQAIGGNTSPDMGEQGRCAMEYGLMASPEEAKAKREEKATNILLERYPTSIANIDLRFGEQRYFDDEARAQLSARNIGIMMHSVLSEARNREEASLRIAQLQTSGRIDKQQGEELSAMIEREFSRPQVQEWFSEWDEVRTESDILCSHSVGTRRPDRVMISGERAVVVDYKFGERHSKAYERQVKEYMQLLTQMGYRQTEGYLWYLSTGEIVKIEN